MKLPSRITIKLTNILSLPSLQSTDDAGQGEEALPRDGREGQEEVRPGDVELCAAQGSGHRARQEAEAGQGSQCAQAITVSHALEHSLSLYLSELDN